MVREVVRERVLLARNLHFFGGEEECLATTLIVTGDSTSKVAKSQNTSTSSVPNQLFNGNQVWTSADISQSSKSEPKANMPIFGRTHVHDTMVKYFSLAIVVHEAVPQVAVPGVHP